MNVNKNLMKFPSYLPNYLILEKKIDRLEICMKDKQLKYVMKVKINNLIIESLKKKSSNK